MTTEIPKEFAEVTSGWLTEVMALDDEVVDLEWQRIAEGVGLLGRLARMSLTWRNQSGPSSVIVKLPSVIPEMIEMAQMFGFYDREINFYSSSEVIESVRVPRCWHVEAAPEAMPFIIVMEDLVDARVVDQLEGCSLEDGLRVARAAARLHAPMWDKPELCELAWLPMVNGPLYAAAQPVLETAFPTFADRWGPAIGAQAVELASGVVQHLHTLQNRAAEGPLTMCHYDLRLDNLLFDDASADVAMIDFQLMGTQRGPFDMAYFLGWSMTPEQRRAHADEILDAYGAELAREGVDLDRRWIDEVYRESMLMVVAMSVITGAQAVTENERGDALVEAFVTRVAAAAADLNSAEFLPG